MECSRFEQRQSVRDACELLPLSEEFRDVIVEVHVEILLSSMSLSWVEEKQALILYTLFGVPGIQHLESQRDDLAHSLIGQEMHWPVYQDMQWRLDVEVGGYQPYVSPHIFFHVTHFLLLSIIRWALGPASVAWTPRFCCS